MPLRKGGTDALQPGLFGLLDGLDDEIYSVMYFIFPLFICGNSTVSVHTHGKCEIHSEQAQSVLYAFQAGC